MGNLVKKGSADITDYVFIQDSSDGSPETGVTITDLDLQYVRAGASPAAKVDATALAAIDSAHGDNKMFEVDGTDQPGLYRVDWPDAPFASGVDKVICTVKGTGFHPVHKEYQLVDFDPEDAVRLGLTALPNAAAEAAGGLYTRGTGAGQVNQDANGRLDANAAAISQDATAADNLELACDNYSATRGLSGTALPAAAAAAAGGIPLSTAGSLEMDTLADWINGGRLDLLLDAIPTTAMRGTDNAALASVLGALADAAAAGDPTSADTLMQYLKQVVNLLAGTDGIGTMPAAADPANGVNLFEMLRAAMGATFATATDSLEQVEAGIAAIPTTAMRGTDSALLAANVPANFSSFSIDANGRIDVGAQLGVIFGFTGQIQAVTADTPSAGITRITISDPGLDEDEADQLNSSAFYLVDRSQQKVIEAYFIGDYDFTNLYVYIDEKAVTPTTAMDYLIAFLPKASPNAGDVSEVDLRDDAITSAKFDESSAFPLESADTGATEVARTGADGDTLEDLSDQVDTIPTTAMRGTDNAALASVATETRLAELDAANLPADVDTLLGRITTTLFNGITSLAEWLGLIAGKQSGDATARTEVRATGAGSGTYDETADSQEALRDRGDSAWITGGGGAITQILNVQPVLPVSIDLANTATVRLGLILTNAVDDLPSTAEITPGTISIERKAIGGTSWSAVVTDAAMSEQAGMVYYDEVFDAGTGYAEGDSIRVTFKSVSITADANDHEVCDANGIIFQTEIRETMRGTDSAFLAANAPTNFSSLGIESDGDLTKVDTLDGHTPQTGDNFARIGATGSGLTSLAQASVATETRLAELDAANMPADLDTLLGRITAALFSGITSLAEWLGLIAGKQVGDATARTEIRATGAGSGAFDETTDSNEAISDDTQDLQSRMPAALVSGRMDSSVGAMASDVVTSSAVATDAIGSDEFADSAAQKIRDEILPTQNVAFNNIQFLWVAASDHVTPVTGATGTSVTRAIDGGSFSSATGSLAEIGNGIYAFDASQADMNGGKITFRFAATGGTPGAPDDAFVTIVTGGGV